MSILKNKSTEITKTKETKPGLASAMAANAPRYANGGRIPDNADLKENYKDTKLKRLLRKRK